MAPDVGMLLRVTLVGGIGTVKEHLGNTAGGANLFAVAAICALFVVDDGKIVYNGDGTAGAFPFTFLAANAAGLTGFSGIGTLIVVAAVNDEPDIFRDDMDQMVGAFFCAKTTADTKIQINFGKAVLDVNGTVGTHRHTVAIAKAAVGAQGVTGKEQVGSRTAANTNIFMAMVHIFGAAAAGNISDLSHRFGGLNAKSCRNIGRGLTAAGDTKGGVGDLTLSQRMGVTIAAGIATGAAVCTGKAFPNSKESLIFRDGHKFGSNHQHDTADDANDGDSGNWNDNTHIQTLR